MRRAEAVLLAYFVMGALGVLGSLLAGNDPLATPAWLGVTGAASPLLSLGLGATLALLAIAATRALVRRFAWGRALHAELRPLAQDGARGTLFLSALGSGVAEELFFRGMLVPVAGVLVAAVAFGALHQVDGRARWAWALSATVVGLALGVLYVATGSLLGCIVAHVVINAANLRFLRDHDFAPPPRRLGGILGGA